MVRDQLTSYVGTLKLSYPPLKSAGPQAGWSSVVQEKPLDRVCVQQVDILLEQGGDDGS